MNWDVIARAALSIRQLIRGTLEVSFLRLYAVNLERTYRSEPKAACFDAIFQLVGTLIFVSTPFIALVMGLDTQVKWEKSAIELLVALVVVPQVFGGMYLFKRMFGHYENEPALAQEYRDEALRRWTNVWYFIFPFICLGVAAVIFRIVKST